MQVPEYVLDRLAVITQPQSQTGARRLRALAFLAPLIQLYGQRQLRLRNRENMESLAGRVKIQVSASCALQVGQCAISTAPQY